MIFLNAFNTPALLRTLMATYGHAGCGVYAELIEGGSITVGDAVTTSVHKRKWPGHILQRLSLRRHREERGDQARGHHQSGAEQISAE